LDIVESDATRKNEELLKKWTLWCYFHDAPHENERLFMGRCQIGLWRKYWRF
jgi:hypothetical protein